MSRIGRAPVKIPAGVEININNGHLEAKGPRGKLNLEISKRMIVKVENGHVLVERQSDIKEDRSLHGLTRSLINNIVEGVSKGFEKDLELVGVGYRASVKGKDLELLVGYSKPVNVPAIGGIEFEVSAPTKIKIKGIDKQLVGQVAANIRSVRPPEPYKGKGIKYADEHVRRKAGKAAKV
jgi:large subunit ribosomal protein L6